MEGYPKDLGYMLDLDVTELDFGISVLILVVWMTLLLSLEWEDTLTDLATE